jgi:hypothetical protein
LLLAVDNDLVNSRILLVGIHKFVEV